MKEIAVYGKGGIGKSTITSALSAAFADNGSKVMQIGCDPKADSSLNLLGGKELTPVLDILRAGNLEPSLREITAEGYKGVIAVEAGGPTPGLGCAGRGIITTFELMEELDAFGHFDPNIVMFDVLGDVVCGGFAAPIRENYADEILVVTSGEKMSLYAANNIISAVRSFEDRGYAKLAGLILNRRNVENEEAKVRAFAEKENVEIIADIPRSDEIQRCEEENMTVLEGAPGSEIADIFREFAGRLCE